MTYFKIVKNNKVIDVGCVFLKWNNEKKKMYICDVDDAQFVQTYDESKIYKASWLNPAPKEAGSFKSAKVVVIDETEFNDLNELLGEGEVVSEQVEEEQRQEPQKHDEIPEEKPMTIAEMREKIIEQQKQIESLLTLIQKQ